MYCNITLLNSVLSQHYSENLTRDNKEFIQETIAKQYGQPALIYGVQTYDSPLKNIEKVEPVDWFPGIRRTSTIARKIGIQPMWMKDGTRVMTTLLHVSLFYFMCTVSFIWWFVFILSFRINCVFYCILLTPLFSDC